MTSDPWYPLLALRKAEPQDGSSFQPEAGSPLPPTPSPRLKEALTELSQALREQLGEEATGQAPWLLLALDKTPAKDLPSPFEVGRVLEEMRHRFLDLKLSDESPERPDIEAFLREKMRTLGFDELGSAPLLPELQREALRGLGVGIGSQMAQLLGRMAGWHGESKPSKSKTEPESKTKRGVRLLRLELGSELAADKPGTALLRQSLSQTRRKLSSEFGWELGALVLGVSKELDPHAWRLLLRGEEAVTGDGLEGLPSKLEAVIGQRAEALLSFMDFEAMLAQPGCKLVAKELRAQGLEKSMLWTIFRRVVASGGHLREPLTVLERILEASATSHQLPFLVQAALSSSAEI